MIPSPRRTVSTPMVPVPSWPDVDDDDGWQDMPVVRSDDNPLGLDEEDQKRYHYKPPARLSAEDPVVTGNATGTHLEVEADTLITDSWRDKLTQDESDYTRLRLDEDEESEEVHMRTRYLFDEDKAMTPLSQMQATKNLLTEGQRIAYVGLCQLIAKRMLKDIGRGWEGAKLKGKGKSKAEVPVIDSGNIWMLKIMARLYQHMELERDEQRMIESLAEHGVDPSDLVPALMATHTVKNPEYDPKAKEKAALAALEEEEGGSESETEAPPQYQREGVNAVEQEKAESRPSSPVPLKIRNKVINPFGDDEDDETFSIASSSSSMIAPPLEDTRPSAIRLPSYDLDEDDEGDIGGAMSPTPPASAHPMRTFDSPTESSPAHTADSIEKTPQTNSHALPPEPSSPALPSVLPALPGVSTHLSTIDEVVTLDIRWTVLCDLFLVLIADSVYDSRSRVFLERVANALGFEWLDVVRFENRVTDALEIQEGVESLQQDDVIEGRRKRGMRKRYAMMGLATIGGGLVIGLSAGLLAPFIGAGLGAAFATVGITGTTGFLAGAGGAAAITTGGVLTGSHIAGKGMARRTREVRTFEFRPLHNNKRVNCYITIGGFMASKVDDVRLPFSVMDPIVGDVFSVLWEPEMMSEMGNALKILTTEVITQVGQQILQATLMTALMSALQWPMILTKLGYLIDNPWSNALDRSRAAGLVLADTLIQRHAGVRPISLIGYSLGARVVFYALVELARAKAYGIVQDVFLFGTTVTASKATWLDVRSVVAGRFVNGFATSDWMLGYLFRATSGGLNTVAGLRPVESVPGLENVDVTDVITGHMSYRTSMPRLLAKVGFPVTADYFDEPEDPEVDMSIQERTVVNEEEEAAKANKKKILGLFPRSSGSKGTSGAVTPSSASKTPPNDDDDELPPRETAASPALPSSARHSLETTATDEDSELKAIPKTAGFDFRAISKELGKEIDVDRLPIKAPTPLAVSPIEVKFASQLERSESAPPFKQQLSSASEDEEDISTSTNGLRQLSFEEPSWDKPSIAAGGFNAWSATAPLRSAPPARPHPPELLAFNPFAQPANGGVSPSREKDMGMWGGTSKVEEEAEENPW
ncbi:hypothetical protein P7C73_g2499, partial [Tremellales sp. Uapishka_1]